VIPREVPPPRGERKGWQPKAPRAFFLKARSGGRGVGSWKNYLYSEYRKGKLSERRIRTMEGEGLVIEECLGGVMG